MSDREENNNLHDELDAAYAELDNQPDATEPDMTELANDFIEQPDTPVEDEAPPTEEVPDPEVVDPDKPNTDAASEPVDPEKAAESSTEPKAQADIDAEDAEIIKSLKPRAQERFKQLTASVKETQAQAEQAKADVEEFRGMVLGTGASAEEFGQALEILRLMKSGSPEDKRVALQQLETQREMLCRELGEEAPGIDLLADCPDLKQAVENMEITPAYANQLAKVRRQEQQVQQRQQAEQSRAQETQQFQASFDQAAASATAIFKSFEHETDYPAKMKMIESFVKQPGKMAEIVNTYRPEQLPAYFRDLYQNIRSAPAAPAPQPIRSRPTHTGKPASDTLRDALASAADHIGI